MRASWRLLRVFWTTFTHTLVTAVVVRWRPAAERAAYRAWRQHTGCRKLCRILGVRVTVEGTWPERGGMLLVCNHFGVLDPLVVASQVPLAAASKAEVRDWPLVGWVCRTMGVLFVERGRHTQTGSFVETVQDRLHHAVHVLVFPEGTTTAERRVQPFKTGAFEAVADLPHGAVLPLHLDVVAVEGELADEVRRNRVVWADASVSFVQNVWQLFGLQSVEMRLCVGAPLATEGCDRKELARLAHARVAALTAGVDNFLPGVSW